MGRLPASGILAAMEPKAIALVDSHCHLAWDSFTADLDDVLERMRESSVLDAVVVATDAASARRGLALCAASAGLHPTAGLHPNDVPDDLDGELARLAELVGSGGFCAVGETGLDYYRDAVDPARQHRSFRRHADLAADHDLPLVVHIRDRDGSERAFEDVARLLEERRDLRGVIHCYTGSRAYAERYLAAGFFISFSGILTFPKGGNVRDVAAATPLERTLVETDAPFLAPEPWRGRRNEPAFVGAVARRLAELRGLDEAEVRQRTAANARALFRLPPRDQS